MSALSSFHQSAVLGLCRERVPLGVQARGLKLDRRDVKAAALEFLKQGDIGELPADDIRAGRAFSWPETMLPDAPDFEALPMTGAEHAAAIDPPPCSVAAVPLQDGEASAAELPSRYWNGRRLSDRHLIVARALAEAPSGACVPIAKIGAGLDAHGFIGARRSVQVAVAELRRIGFVVAFDIDYDGYVLSKESRARWMGGNHA